MGTDMNDQETVEQRVLRQGEEAAAKLAAEREAAGITPSAVSAEVVELFAEGKSRISELTDEEVGHLLSSDIRRSRLRGQLTLDLSDGNWA